MMISNIVTGKIHEGYQNSNFFLMSKCSKLRYYKNNCQIIILPLGKWIFFWNLETPDWFDIRLKKVRQKSKALWFDEFFLKKPYLHNRTFSQNFITNVQLWIKSIFSSILGKHIDKASYRTYCLMGDGESMEGNVWEALNFAGKYLNQLFLLCCFWQNI